MPPKKSKGPAVARQALDLVWWSQTGSNRRPLQCHCSALPAELWPRNPEQAARGINPAFLTGNRGCRQRLAVAFALVVLDLDLDFGLDVLGLVGEVVGIRQCLVTLDIGQFVTPQRRL